MESNTEKINNNSNGVSGTKAQSKTKKNSLLIVDDENANLKILTHILGQDYTIYTATNGKNAIKKALELLPDMILLDILMPEMDGYQTLSIIKNTEIINKIPVVFITGLDSEEDEEKGLSLDAADYITKPFSAPVVKLRVRNQIQIVNQMRTIEHLSMIDQLTHLPNRRSFDNRLVVEWRQAIREQTHISLLMMDLDKFKSFNDTYGHQQGDVILKVVSKVFDDSLRRPADFAARWGGEEFTVLLPNTPLEGAIEVAENIRSNVEKTIIKNTTGDNKGDIKITISIGVNSVMPTQQDSIDTFITNADEALYIAKKTGRNKVAAAPA
ncbi:MAG: diguanylate cyclase [Treponema sp.]|nr:diguanylate cyclase [Treponema sp.]MCL2251917.1 diguanylate cyclase [Treponema sp.]